ncbi:NAD(P)/FAD-dependent oxidoreductase [Bradyrhizobium sp. CCBAU 45384]|uniref:NAD(P)/FAD-dependent oxidoreductase n=1 Tax=Bradyrhizobium sp. CCBAU 45384 TaxID=858428 RepID=UPI0023063E4C|nr:FAD-binding oxidoreductase [Bradyrhizobium sp. CCBAU 45384]
MVLKRDYDAIVIGGGSLGLWGGHFLSTAGIRVLVLEREQGVGRLSTNQNARLYSALFYSNAEVASLTRASLPFLDCASSRFFREPLTRPIQVFYCVAKENRDEEIRRLFMKAEASGSRDWRDVTGTDLAAMLPYVSCNRRAAGILENGRRLNVFAITSALRASIENPGGYVLDRTDLLDVERTAAGSWKLITTNGTFTAPVVVNAAGAKCDVVNRWFGITEIGIQCFKRHRLIAHIRQPDRLPPLNQFVFLQSFYFATEDDGQLMMSAEDETLSHPTDTVPDPAEMSKIRRLAQECLGVSFVEEEQWATAGHRPFVADRVPVIGPDPEEPSFFHLSAPGGYGMQAGPAMGLSLASQVLRRNVPSQLEQYGVTWEAMLPARLRKPSAQTVG